MVAENGDSDSKAFNLDIVAMHGYEDLGEGEYADFYLDGRTALLSVREKILIGYPSSLYDDVVRPSTSASKRLMHETNPSFNPYRAEFPHHRFS